MFDASLIQIISSDSVIRGLIAPYQSGYAVFSEDAPEGAEKPFCEIAITEFPVGDSVVAQFSVLVDYFEKSESKQHAKEFCARIIQLLDKAQITNDARYHCIRMSLSNGPRRIPEEDPRDIHYSVEFSARGGRKQYIDYLVSH